MAIVDGDIIRVTDKMSIFGEDVRNVYHVRSDVGTLVANSVFLSQARSWLEDVHADIAPHMVDDYTFESVECFNVTQDEPIGELAYTTTTEGDLTTDPQPLQCAAVVRFPTEVARSQGRKFIAGLSDTASSDGGVVVSSVLTGLATMATTILDGFTVGTDSWKPGNWSETYTRFAPWVSGLVNTVLGTQRRRRIGKGT